MVELSPVGAALLVVVSAFAVVPVVGVTAGQTATATAGTPTTADGAAGNATTTEIEPGARLSAVVGVQRTGLQSEVERRAFGQRVAAAATNTSRASVVRTEVESLRERLSTLREERRELRAAWQNGSISRDQYRARLTRLHAESRALERQTNTTQQVARGLPAEALEAKGINATAIMHLRSNARNLTGPEVAAIARSIAGNGIDRGVGPDRRGPPPGLANRSGPGQRGQVPGQGPDRGPGQADERRQGQGPPGNQTGAGANGSQAADRGDEQRRGQGQGQGPPADRSNGTSGADATDGNETSPAGESGPGGDGVDPGQQDRSGSDDSQRPPADDTTGNESAPPEGGSDRSGSGGGNGGSDGDDTGGDRSSTGDDGARDGARGGSDGATSGPESG